MFSKQAFLRGDYDELSLDPQDLTTVPRYALNFSRRALKHLQETNLLINC
jgi:hypothetical protein